MEEEYNRAQKSETADSGQWKRYVYHWGIVYGLQRIASNLVFRNNPSKDE